MVRPAVGRYPGAVVITFRREPLRWLADRIWKLGQGLLALALPALIALKLTGVIAWSWWWVLLPLWMSSLALPWTFNLPGIRARIWNLGARLAVPALIVLKLTGVIAWSWWWVLSPLWISGLIGLPFVCLLLWSIWWHKRNGDYPDPNDCEPPSGGPTGDGWQWKVQLPGFRRSGTFGRRAST